MRQVFAVLVICALASIGYGAPERFTENFETGWANSPVTLDLCGGAAQTNGWVGSCTNSNGVFALWTTQIGDSANHVIGLPMAWEPYSNIMGKAHGLNLTGVTTMELSFKMSLKATATYYAARGWVWLSDQYQFGYGLSLNADNSGTRRVNIVKFLPNPAFSSTIPFGQEPYFFEKAGQGSSAFDVDVRNPLGYAYQQSDYSTHGESLGANDEEFITMHLRLEQTATGAPVKLTAWHTYSDAVDDSSYSNPDMQIVDDGAGAGGAFSADAVRDITGLTHVAFQSDGDPANSNDFCQLDCIDVYNYAPDTAPKVEDLTRDGTVNLKDLAELAGQWQVSTKLPDQTLSENFSTFVNGGGIDLSTAGASSNGWLIRGSVAPNAFGNVFSVQGTNPNKYLLYNSTNIPGWHVVGKPHGMDVSLAKSIEFSAKITEAKGLYTQLWVWLGRDDDKWGYGFEYLRFNYNLATIIKCEPYRSTGLTAPWTSNLEYAGWEQYMQGAVTSPVVPANYAQVGDWIGGATMHVRLEQDAPGQPVTITMWHTGSATGYPDTSYENPDMVKVDGGTGDDFNYDVIDIKTLTHIGFTCTVDQTSGDTPGYNRLKIGKVDVSTPGIPSLDYNEDYETGFSNGTDGTLDPTKGAQINDWIARANTTNLWSLVTDGANHYINTANTWPLNWKIMGKGHGLDVADATVLDLSAKVSMTGLWTYGLIWLNDGFHNGYGLYINRFNYNQIGIIKWDDRTVAFGTVGAPATDIPIEPWNPASWQGGSNWRYTNDTAGSGSWNFRRPGPLSVDCGANHTGFMNIHLRLEQNAPGMPVKLTAWYTGSGYPDKSYSSPAVQTIDEGATGSWTAPTPRNFINSVMDLKDLTWVGVVFTVDQGQGDTPGSNFARLDDITVRVPGVQTYSSADFNQSGTVGFDDLSSFASQWLWQLPGCCK